MITSILQIYFYLLLLLATGMTVGLFGHAFMGACKPRNPNHGGFLGLWICIAAGVLMVCPLIIPIIVGYMSGLVGRWLFTKTEG